MAISSAKIMRRRYHVGWVTSSMLWLHPEVLVEGLGSVNTNLLVVSGWQLLLGEEVGDGLPRMQREPGLHGAEVSLSLDLVVAIFHLDGKGALV